MARAYHGAVAKPVDPDKLVREQAGRYRTADDRFTVESDRSGAWYVVDSQELDELGLPRVSGPHATLAGARRQVAEARTAPTALGPRIAAKRATKRSSKGGKGPEATERAPRKQESPPPPPPEPAWLGALDADDRAQARRALRALDRLGVRDGERVVRADRQTDVPAVARAVLLARVARDAVARWSEGGSLEEADGEVVARLRKQGADPSDLTKLAARVARDAAGRTLAALDRGHDPDGGPDLPHWRLVEDGAEGRRIPLDPGDLPGGDGD
jgi:hypothetical protein